MPCVARPLAHFHGDFAVLIRFCSKHNDAYHNQ